jgi:hypothetical protein
MLDRRNFKTSQELILVSEGKIDAINASVHPPDHPKSFYHKRRMIMLLDRIIDAITFRKDVYADVERDTSFTSTAWMLVAVVAFLNQLGIRAYDSISNRLFGSVIGMIVTLVAFAIGVWVISWMGRSLFNADVTFDELVRTLGLAYIWNVIGVLGIMTSFSTALSCALAPVQIAAVLLGLIAWFIAAKEALDLDWGQTVITVIVGWVVMALISIVLGGALIGALGLGAAVARGIFG